VSAHVDHRRRRATGSSGRNATVVNALGESDAPNVTRAAAERRVEARVAIRRPVGEVFEFYRDFENLPRADRVPTISRWFVDAGFDEVFVSRSGLRFGVGVHQSRTEAPPLPTGVRAFTFIGH
jgi:hypothetical protein